MYTNNGEPHLLHINLPYQNLPDKWELGFGSTKVQDRQKIDLFKITNFVKNAKHDYCQELPFLYKFPKSGY